MHRERERGFYKEKERERVAERESAFTGRLQITFQQGNGKLFMAFVVARTI